MTTESAVDLPVGAATNPEVALLLAVLEDATREWREELEPVSDEELLRQPFPGGHSIGAVILHIADVEAHWLHEVAAGCTRTEEEVRTLLGDETDQYAVRWPTPPARPLLWYVALHDRVRARTRELIAPMDDLDQVGYRGGTPFTLRWLLAHVIEHEAYHGGQAVLLKLIAENGTAVDNHP